jgi:hypothetical protein
VVHSGYLLDDRVPGLVCDRPVFLVSGCGFRRYVPCRTSRFSKCRPCSVIYRRRLQRVLDSGLQQHSGRFLYLLTVTCPSTQAHRRWVPPEHYRKGMRRPDCSCHQGVTVEDWNPEAGGHWNRLRTSLRRLDPALEFARVTEVQDGSRGGTARGALHHHTVLAATQLLDVDQVQELVTGSGYGCVMDLQRIEVTKGLEHYLTKTLGGYLTKAADSRTTVPWRVTKVDQQTGEIVKDYPGKATYRTHSESRGWGLTVKAIKAAIHEHMARQAALAATTPVPPFTVPEVSPHRHRGMLEATPP